MHGLLKILSACSYRLNRGSQKLYCSPVNLFIGELMPIVIGPWPKLSYFVSWHLVQLYSRL